MSADKRPVRRPGGRTADVTRRVHNAIIQLLIESGVQGCTVKAVAERAGIERSTLYRRFPDRWQAIIDALMARAGAEVVPGPSTNFRADLHAILAKLVDVLESPLGAAFMAAAAELKASKSEGYSRDYFDRRMEQLSPMFDAAVARGELAAEVDREALFSCAAGPLYFRMFIAGRRVDEAFLDSIVELICGRFCKPVPAEVPLPAGLA